MRIRAKFAAVAVLAIAVLTLMPGVASAHEEKERRARTILAVGFRHRARRIRRLSRTASSCS